MTRDKPEMEPCRCGNSSLAFAHDAPDEHNVVCLQCGNEGPACFTEQNAVLAWNHNETCWQTTRPAPRADAALAEELAKAQEELHFVNNKAFMNPFLREHLNNAIRILAALRQPPADAPEAEGGADTLDDAQLCQRLRKGVTQINYEPGSGPIVEIVTANQAMRKAAERIEALRTPTPASAVERENERLLKQFGMALEALEVIADGDGPLQDIARQTLDDITRVGFTAATLDRGDGHG